MRSTRKALFTVLILLITVLQSPLAIIPHVKAETDTFTVSQESDDIYIKRSTSYFDIATYVPCGDYSVDGYDYEAGMRWEVNIPQGSTIESAYLKIVAETQYGLIPETIIHGQDADDPITFNNYTNYIARARTSEFVTWTPSGGIAGTTYTSGDISNVIQEIVDREGFGTHIVLFWSHEIGWGGVQELLYWAGWNHASYDPPKLEVTWTIPSEIETPNKLFGAGFNGSTPVFDLYWSTNLTDISLFEVQNSTDKVSWDYLGSNTTNEYHDFQVVNGTERYYRVRACNFTGAVWDNSTWSDINFEKVYFMPYVEYEADPPINIPQIDKIEFNTTIAGDRCMVTGAFSDAEGLDGYIFWNNATSAPGGVNSSFTALAGTSDHGYENITLPTSGTRMGVRYYVNDTDNNWAIDTLVIFPTILNITEACKYHIFNASSITVIVGTLNDGDLASTYHVDGDWYNVSEVVGPPGMDLRFNFSYIGGNITCGCVEIYKTYTGHSHHEIQIQVWNFTSGEWHKIGKALYNETVDWVCVGLGHMPEHYLNNGTIWFRFYHPDKGHIAHELHIDRIDLRVVYAEECPECPPCEEVPALVAMGKYYALAIILLILGILIGIGMRRKR